MTSFPTIQPDLAALPDRRYRVGTLTYTKAGLASLFAWLLWGDICFTLMESVPGSDFAYRYIPAWGLFFSIIAFVCLCLLYRDWKRRGGEKGYTPPSVDDKPSEASQPVAMQEKVVTICSIQPEGVCKP